ncbi:MAG: TIGR02147 family protein [Oligoflexia bacterium]|nr:TIGR02147 family protein [Oligoflexia bacterium]
MISIYEYDSYRTFLKAFFSSKKKSDSKYSLTYFSKLIKGSDSYLKLILSGKRNLNLDKAKFLAEKILLDKLETSYFLTLVMHEHAETKELKDYLLNNLNNIRELNDFKYSKKENEKSIFKNSLMLEVYTLLGCADSKLVQNSESMEKLLTNKMANKEEIKKAIDFLLGHRLIELIDNKYKTKDIILEDGDDIKSIYISSLERAIEYLQNRKEKSPMMDHFDSFCLIVGEDDFSTIKGYLEETKRKMAALVNKSQKKEFICYYNTSLFPASHISHKQTES